MPSLECEKLNLKSRFAAGVCEALVESRPQLKAADIAGMSPLVEPEPLPQTIDEYVPDRKLLSTAYILAKRSYEAYVQCLKDRSAETACGSIEETLFFRLMEAGLYVPWFFYSDAAIEFISEKLSPVSKKFAEDGDAASAGESLYTMIFDKKAFGVIYDVDTSFSIEGSEAVLERKVARCDELGFLIKGFAILAEIPEPNIYDTLKARSALDHIYSSYSVREGEFFFDPVKYSEGGEMVFFAESRPEYPTAKKVTDMHLLGVFEMNAVTRNCSGTNKRDCAMEKASKAHLYSANYRNELSMGLQYQLRLDQEEAEKHFERMCKLRPEYFQCK